MATNVKRFMVTLDRVTYERLRLMAFQSETQTARMARKLIEHGLKGMMPVVPEAPSNADVG